VVSPGILGKLLPALHDASIVTEDLHLPHNYDDLENVYRGLCVLPPFANPNGLGKSKDQTVAGIRRRIDILTVPWENRGAALLYYTV
jgi:DNA polymerase lambda